MGWGEGDGRWESKGRGGRVEMEMILPMGVEGRDSRERLQGIHLGWYESSIKGGKTSP